MKDSRATANELKEELSSIDQKVQELKETSASDEMRQKHPKIQDALSVVIAQKRLLSNAINEYVALVEGTKEILDEMEEKVSR